MAMYSVAHHTVHDYPSEAFRSRNEVRLQPRQDERQHLLDFRLEVTPDAELHPERDYFGNPVWLVSVEAPHRRLVIRSTAVVEVAGGPTRWPPRRWSPAAIARSPAHEYLLPSPRIPRLEGIRGLVHELGGDGLGTDLMELNRRLPEILTYVPGSTAVSTPLEEMLVNRRGVCQDFAHLLIAMAREMGWPARYVSGYLAPEHGSTTGESHAWVEIGDPDGGWTGLDPTHGSVVDQNHIAVAAGRDYDDAAPLRGSFVSDRPGEPPQVEVRIERLPDRGRRPGQSGGFGTD